MNRRDLHCIDPYTGFRRFYPQRKTTLYYVKFAPKGMAPIYKIGITTTSVKQRFYGEGVPYTIIFTKEYASGKDAYIEEQRVLQEYSSHLLPYTEILKSGNSELFSVDIRQYSNKGSL